MGIAFFLILQVSTMHAQQEYLNEVGFPHYLVTQPVEHGAIGLNTGNVRLEIPLGNYVQRGKVRLQPKLVYNSRIWEIVSNGMGGKVWSPNVLNGNTGGWVFQTSVASSNIGYVTTVTNCSGGSYYAYNGFYWIDGHGTRRDFPITTVTNISGSCYPTNEATGSAYAEDSSGYQMFVSGSTAKVFSPDGTEVDSHYIDANGNSFTTNGSGNIVDTVGRAPFVVTPTASGYTVTVLNSQGSTSTYTVKTANEQAQTNFGVANVTEYTGPVSEVTGVSLPDGTSYTFGYDGYSGVNSMTLPTGGQVKFGYSNFEDAIGEVNRWVSSYTARGSTWGITQAVVSGCANISTSCQQSTTVARPSGASTVDVFTIDGGAWLTSAKKLDVGGTLLYSKTISYDFSNACTDRAGACYVRPLQENDVTPGASGTNLNRQTTWTYDSPQTGNVTAKKEWKYYTGTPGSTPDRETDTGYNTIAVQSGVNTYPNSVTIYVPASRIVKGAGGTQLAKTLYSYDGTTLTGATGVTNHDDTHFGTSNTKRGNLTQVQNLVSGSTYLTSSKYYDTTGQMVKSTDTAGNATSYSYADNFYDDNGSNPSATHSTSSPSNAHVTKVTLPRSGSLTYGYYYGTGKQAMSVDQNSADSYTHYMDPMDRMTTAYGPTTSGGRSWKLNNYTSGTKRDVYTATSNGTASPSCTACKHVQTTFDSWGRNSSNTLESDPDGAATFGFTYDMDGRTETQSNPSRSSSDPMYGSDTMAYDGLDRMMTVTHADSNKKTNSFGANNSQTQMCSTSTYGIGFPTYKLDEANKQVLNWTDGFGRLIEVDEPNSANSLAYATCYNYDAQGNLVGTKQGTQTRSRVYDDLSRVTSKTDPESGTTTYSYSGCSGNPSAVCSRTDARNITTTYTYDSLNRMTGKTYSDSTPAVTYAYDQTSANGLTIQNGSGRRTSMTDGSGKTTWSFDPAGNILTEQRTVGSVTKTLTYTYNPDGTLANINYPNGDEVQYAYNNARRALSVYDPIDNLAYASVATYASDGQLASVYYGRTPLFSGMLRTKTYNNRRQNTGINDASSNGTVMSHTYSYDLGSGMNNGHLAQLVDNVRAGDSQTFGYDPTNRISTAKSQATSGSSCWGQSFDYDQLGNLISTTPTQCSAPSLSLGINGNNQITNSGFTYDASGNMTNDSSQAYTWDAENHIKSIGSTSYIYDGDGHRVMKSTNEITWYTPGGKPLAETDSTGHNLHEYIYFDGKVIARRDPSGSVYYYFSDHSKSNRVFTDATGHTQQATVYLPYGQELVNGTVDDYKFTGKRRDAESGIDYAHYRSYHPNLGRWLGSDPGPMLLDRPQSLNRYNYVINDPTNETDIEGAETDCIGTEGGYTGCVGESDFGPSASTSLDYSGSMNYGDSTQAGFSDPANGASGFVQVDPSTGSGIGTFQFNGSAGSSGPADGTPLADPSQEAAFQQAEAQASAEQALALDNQGLTDTSGDILGLALAVGTFGGSAELDAASFLDGTTYSTKVLGQMDQDIYHGFPTLVDTFAGDGSVSSFLGGDGSTYLQLDIPGAINGTPGTYQYIKDASGLINHRMFAPY